MKLTPEQLTEVMKNTVTDMLACYDCGNEWDEDLLKSVQRRKNKPGWSRRWYLSEVKDNGGFNFSEIGPSYWFAQWVTKEALNCVDWAVIDHFIIETLNTKQSVA